MKCSTCRLFALCLLSVAFAGSAFAAEDLRGRCVAFDKSKHTVTVVLDTGSDPRVPQFTLPTRTFEIPTNIENIKVGKRIQLNLSKNTVTYYDDASASLKVIDFVMVEKIEGVLPDNPLVKDGQFPKIDKETQQISLYSKRLKLFVVITVNSSGLNQPETTYDSGADLKLTVEGSKALKIEQ